MLGKPSRAFWLCGRIRRCVFTTSSCVEDDFYQFVGEKPISFTSELVISDPTNEVTRSAYRILGRDGRLCGSHSVSEEKKALLDIYEIMIRLQSYDDIMYNAQRQGRISFYMQNTGEEASTVGSASALINEDMVFAQYREMGVLFYRGFSVQEAADQCFGNSADSGKGRQMPVHYGSKKLNFQTISSPLTTQMPQAVGAAYAYRLSGKEAVVICYFGEGAASEGDFHAAMNFASTLDVPIIFFCRNNGYAISTGTRDQYRGDGIVSRAAGYGMKSIRVDGNDVMAVKVATEAAREIAIRDSCPVLIEAISYRRGHHSTSDDSTKYRSVSEIQHWQKNSDPVVRLRRFLEYSGSWSSQLDQKLRDKERYAVIRALEVAEARAPPKLSELFNDVYAEKTKPLLRQEQELQDHLKKYPDVYTNNNNNMN